MTKMRFAPLLPVFFFGAGCSDDAAGNKSGAANEVAAGALEDATVLAEDPELANEAAADEAADAEAFGGNAAALDGNQR